MMQRPLNTFKSFLSLPLKKAADFVLPSTCVVCEEIVAGEKGMGICPSCWVFLPRWNKEIDILPALPKYVDSFEAPFLYEDPVRLLVKNIKFNDCTEYVKPLAKFLKISALENPLILPVPMHEKRLWRRQFNQAVLFARELSDRVGAPLNLFSFQRIKATEQQVGKSASARKRNLQGAFQVDQQVVEGKDIILVDDVWTTGSTANACAMCLKKAGANSVHVVALCYVPR